MLFIAKEKTIIIVCQRIFRMILQTANLKQLSQTYHIYNFKLCLQLIYNVADDINRKMYTLAIYLYDTIFFYLLVDIIYKSVLIISSFEIINWITLASLHTLK